MNKSPISEFDELCELCTLGQNLYAQWAKQNGFSANEFYVLYYLSMRSGSTQQDIAEEWSLPKQTVSAVCKQLHAKGLLQHSPGAADRREKRLSLTAHGKSITLPMVEKLSAIEAQTAQQFCKEKCTELIHQIRILLNLLADNMRA